MKDGQKLLAELGAARVATRSTSAPTTCSPPATARPRSSGAAPTPTPKTRRASRSTTGRSSTASSTPTWSAASSPTCRSASCRRRSPIKPEPYQHEWRPGLPYNEIYTGWAYPPKDYAKWARAGLPVGQALRREVRARGSGDAGTGKSGTSPTSRYWQGTPEEFHKLHDYAIDAVRRALPTAQGGRAGHRGRRGGQVHCATSSSTACAARTTRRARRARPSTSSPFTPRGRPTVVDGHVQMGIANQLRTIDDGLAVVASFPELKRQADRHRRIRPRRLRRLPGTAARLSQRHDVLELHRGQLRPQARPGREARRQPRRRPHLGLRVRGPAVLRGLPGPGQQRHRPARC